MFIVGSFQFLEIGPFEAEQDGLRQKAQPVEVYPGLDKFAHMQPPFG
jgi:hypothetical protein